MLFWRSWKMNSSSSSQSQVFRLRSVPVSVFTATLARGQPSLGGSVCFKRKRLDGKTGLKLQIFPPSVAPDDWWAVFFFFFFSSSSSFSLQGDVHERPQREQADPRPPEERGPGHPADHHHLRLHRQPGHQRQHRGAAVRDRLLPAGLFTKTLSDLHLYSWMCLLILHHLRASRHVVIIPSMHSRALHS